MRSFDLFGSHSTRLLQRSSKADMILIFCLRGVTSEMNDERGQGVAGRNISQLLF
jgi:hypothetical protein